MLGEIDEQRRVLHGRGAVTDPFGAQDVDGVPDRLGPGGLAGVWDRVETRGAGLREDVGELRPRHPDLGATEPEPDEAGRPVLERVPHGLDARRETQLTRDVPDPAHGQPEIALGDDAYVLYRLDGHACAHVGHRRAGQLDVADVLARQLLGDAVSEGPDVLRGAYEVDDRQVQLDEVGEVGEREVVSQGLRVRRHRAGMPRGELGDDRGRRRADVVDVQLRLGQALDEPLDSWRGAWLGLGQ